MWTVFWRAAVPLARCWVPARPLTLHLASQTIFPWAGLRSCPGPYGGGGKTGPASALRGLQGRGRARLRRPWGEVQVRLHRRPLEALTRRDPARTPPARGDSAPLTPGSLRAERPAEPGASRPALRCGRDHPRPGRYSEGRAVSPTDRRASPGCWS